MTTGAESFLRGLRRLNRAVERASRRLQTTWSVTAQQRAILWLVGRFPGLTPSQLCRELHLDPGTVSAILKRLERKGFVQRQRDHRDRRRVSVGLTRRGRLVDLNASGILEQGVSSVVGGLGAHEVTIVCGALEQVADVVEALLGEASKRREP